MSQEFPTVSLDITNRLINSECCCWLLLYRAITGSQADLLRSHVILHEWLAFYSPFFVLFLFLFNIHRSGVLTALAWLVPHETAGYSARSVYTIQPCSTYSSVCLLAEYACMVRATLRASLSGTFLQTLPDLVTPLKRHSLSPRSCPPTRSAPSERFGS